MKIECSVYKGIRTCRESRCFTCNTRFKLGATVHVAEDGHVMCSDDCCHSYREEMRDEQESLDNAM